MLAVGLAGCGVIVPDQTPFPPLTAFIGSTDAVARLYGATIPGIEAIAIHPWFAIRAAGARTFTRWEVWQDAGGPYGHVRKNLMSASSHVGGGPSFVLAQLRGAAAEPIVEFVETQSPDYPCRNRYVLFPGPNSNSYAQWVLEETGWDVTLPPTAIGKDVPANCTP